MPTDLFGSATYPTGFQIPSDGDKKTAASVNAAFTALANRTAYLRENMAHVAENETISGQWSFATSPKLTGTTSLLLDPVRSYTKTVGGFGICGSAAIPIVFPTAAALAPGELAFFPVCGLPGICLVTAYGMTINPADDTLPTTKAKISIWSVDRLTGAATKLSEQEDPLTGASYQAQHTIEKTGVLHAIDYGAQSYFIRLEGEAGGDTDAIDLIAAPWVTYTVDVVGYGV